VAAGAGGGGGAGLCSIMAAFGGSSTAELRHAVGRSVAAIARVRVAVARIEAAGIRRA
jgi:hypothetical protein